MEETGTQATTTNNGEQATTSETTLLNNDQTKTSPDRTTASGSPQQGGEQADRKTGDEAPELKTDVAPETYEFKAPEGQAFDKEFLKVYSETAKELNLTQEKAQTLIDKISPVLEQRQMARIQEIRSDWEQSSRSDKEFGGDKLDANLSVAKQALDKHGTPELKELINMSGLGNHPELIRFFYRVGKEMTPDTFVGGHRPEGKGHAPKSFNDIADKLYAT